MKHLHAYERQYIQHSPDISSYNLRPADQAPSSMIWVRIGGWQLQEFLKVEDMCRRVVGICIDVCTIRRGLACATWSNFTPDIPLRPSTTRYHDHPTIFVVNKEYKTLWHSDYPVTSDRLFKLREQCVCILALPKENTVYWRYNWDSKFPCYARYHNKFPIIEALPYVIAFIFLNLCSSMPCSSWTRCGGSFLHTLPA